LKIGFVTLGQAPRVDIFNEIKHLLPQNVEIIEKGVLDYYTIDEIEKLQPIENEMAFVTRLRNGEEVKLSRSKILELLERKIKELVDEKAGFIIILCTGEFPELVVKASILYPFDLLAFAVSLIKPKSLGILAPTKDQIDYLTLRWSKLSPKVIVKVISPYKSDTQVFSNIGKELANNGIKVVVMDCIGYSISQAKAVASALGGGSIVLNPRLLIANFISSLILANNR